MNDIIPQKLGDKYMLLDLIGVGGMAEVYRAKLIGERGFEKLIVIKKLLDQAVREPSLVEHFTAEARLAALLQHENIAAVYDFGCISNNYFIAMEYLFGKDLFAILQALQTRGKSIPPQYALMIASKISEAMAYAHGLTDLRQKPLNIIHRDLTPHNIFISYDGRVKVIDFGIAKTEMHENLTRVGVVKGKITYMSPEQLSSERIDHRSDIFSIGILLYEMLSGRRMYAGDTASLIRKAVKVEYTPLEKIVPGLDTGIYGILHKALARMPDDRYADCEEMRADLEKCLGDYSLYYDPRLLSQFVTSLFESEYRHEEGVCRKALQAAALYESSNVDDEEKTDIFIPDFNSTGIESIEKRSEDKSEAVAADKKASFLSWLGPFPSSIKAPSVTVLLIIVIIGLTAMLFIRSDRDDSGVAGIEASAPLKKNDGRDKEEKASSGIAEEEQQESYSAKRTADNLILKASRALNEGRIETPPGNNALYYYQEVEKHNPGDHRINDGMRLISDYYAQQAENALVEMRYEVASRMISKGLEVYPSSGRLSGIRERLRDQTQNIISDLKEKMEVSLSENRLTSPPDDCALKYIEEISRLDNENALVHQGYKRIADRYAVLAENAFKQAEYSRARYYVREGLQVVPDHTRLITIKHDLSRGTPGLIFKTLEKNVKTLIDL